VLDDRRPHDIAVAANDGVRLALLARLFWKQRGVNAAEDNPRAACAGESSDRIAAQRIARMDADADDVAGCERRGIDVLQRFVNHNRIAPARAGCRSQHIQPPRRDDRHAKRSIARIDEVHAGRGHRHVV
jgi:hypothetical protein